MRVPGFTPCALRIHSTRCSRVRGSVAAGQQPSGMSISRDGRLALVANRAAGTVSVLRIAGLTATPLTEVKVGQPAESASDVALTPDGRRALVSLQKAGVLLQQLQSDRQLQASLLAPLEPGDQERRRALMAVVDDLNRRYGSTTVQWAACGLAPRWAMRRSRLSGAATTRLSELPRVWA